MTKMKIVKMKVKRSLMDLDFRRIKSAVAKQFEEMQSHPMFRANVTGDELWDAYLSSFPAGTNPMLRERTEHDCSSCRHFIRDVGNAIAVTESGIVTIWDAPTGDESY